MSLIIRWIAITLVFFNTCIISIANAANVPEIIAKVDLAVGIVHAYDSRGQEISFGTGFVISQAGEFITNRHVIENSSYIEIEMNSGKKFGVKRVLGVHNDIDLVKLQLDTKNLLPYLNITDKLPMKGEEVLAVGNPTGLKFAVSNGIVSAIQDLPEISSGPFIQFTAPVSPGSSGGPLINLQGEVVGIVTLTKVTGQNLNFAIPSSNILQLVDDPGVNLIQNSSNVERKNTKPVIAICNFGNSRIWQNNKANEIINNTVVSKVQAANYNMEYNSASLRRNIKEFFDGVVPPNEDVNLVKFGKEVLTKLGKKYNYDYVLAMEFNLDAPPGENKVNLALTIKALDVQSDKYLYFDTIRVEGNDNNFWAGGNIDKAIFNAISKAMVLFSSQVSLPKQFTFDEFNFKSKYDPKSDW